MQKCSARAPTYERAGAWPVQAICTEKEKEIDK